MLKISPVGLFKIALLFSKGERGPRGAPGPQGDSGIGFPGNKVNLDKFTLNTQHFLPNCGVSNACMM